MNGRQVKQDPPLKATLQAKAWQFTATPRAFDPERVGGAHQLRRLESPARSARFRLALAAAAVVVTVGGAAVVAQQGDGDAKRGDMSAGPQASTPPPDATSQDVLASAQVDSGVVEVHGDGSTLAICLTPTDGVQHCSTPLTGGIGPGGILGSWFLIDGDWYMVAGSTEAEPVVRHPGDISGPGDEPPPVLPGETATADGWHLAVAKIPADLSEVFVWIGEGATSMVRPTS